MGTNDAALSAAGTTDEEPDPRLAPIANPDGSVNRTAVEALLNRHPRTLTLPELQAMQAVLDKFWSLKDSPVAGLIVTSEWLKAFVAVTGGTITREKIWRGETVSRSVERFHGREDVRRYRTQNQARRTPGTARSRAREPHPRRARRTSSSSRTSSSDPPPDGESESDGDSELPTAGRPCAAPWCDHPVYGPRKKIYCDTDRCNQARAKERKRQSRLRASVDLVELERREALENARRAGYIGHKAFAPAGEHALSFLWGTRWSLAKIIDDGDDPGELHARALWIWCRCNGHHIDDGEGGCFRCGHWRGAVVA